MTKKAKLKIDLNHVGVGKVFLNDEDISSQVRAVSVVARVGEATIATLEFILPQVEMDVTAYLSESL